MLSVVVFRSRKARHDQKFAVAVSKNAAHGGVAASFQVLPSEICAAGRFL
jgi:hypothetical protein